MKSQELAEEAEKILGKEVNVTKEGKRNLGVGSRY